MNQVIVRPRRYRAVLDAHDWSREAYVTKSELEEMSPHTRTQFLLWKPDVNRDRLLNPKFHTVD
jgi:hypothetical protein